MVPYLKASAAAASVVFLILAIWFASDIFLMAFAGLILATLLRSAANLLSRTLHLRGGIALFLAVFILLLLFASLCWVSLPRLQDEFFQLQSQLPASWNQLVRWAHKNHASGEVVDKLQTARFWYKQTAGRITAAFSSAASVVGGIVVILFVALYFAADPTLYVRGVVKLLPKHVESRGTELLSKMHEQLLRWLLSKLSLMTFVGVATAIGLWLLGVPLILSLALFAALLDFVPNIGPVVSVIPAMLIAFTNRPMLALEVGAVYLAVQIVESYVLAPLVQKRAVSLPPALTLLAQVFIGTLFGPLGLIVATPLTVVLLTLINMAYVEDLLGKRAGA